ncbi:hypothetical protein YB2330_001168 [Saitoella coloradoensis]
MGDFKAPTNIEELEAQLANDRRIKVAGIDADGVLRGKVMSKEKFLSAAKTGFGFCSVIFGWDIVDANYYRDSAFSHAGNGFADIEAVVDLSSFRRIPWEGNIPFFLVSFNGADGKPLSVCPRTLLRSVVDKFRNLGYEPMSGMEYEFFQFKETANSLAEKKGVNLEALTPGMFGYSITRPALNQEYFYKIFDQCEEFRCDIEGLHTETGPGVYEAALAYTTASEIADRATLFKLACKNIGVQYGITPSFMAKPYANQPGTSGHTHVSLVDMKTGKNAFTRDEEDSNAAYPDIRNLSDVGRHFLAGVVEGLPDVMPMFCPTINSYKRLVEGVWAPVTQSWGYENRVASVRLIGPPTASPKATRIEFRVPGADMHPHYALATILALGLRGIEKKLELDIPPLDEKSSREFLGTRLAKNLRTATELFKRKESIAREVLGDEFVDHYALTREHECKVFDEAVTDWELKRYLEMV